jgi:pyruvate formate lyase activating enzyme
MKGLIFSIKRYCIHDGPGIRVTVFMKGCPLSCKWCHNPEGISPDSETVVNTYWIGERKFCRNEDAGKFYSVEDIIDLLEREKVFMNHSRGGVTFSGGEPMLQFEFLAEALKACKEKGYHTAVDTSGYSLAENYKSILPYSDLFLFDIKHLDNNKHIEATGVSNAGILENFRFLLENAAALDLRIPVIPGFNDDSEYIDILKQYILSTRTEVLKKVNLLPFHKIGSSKYRRFGLPNRMEGIEPPDKNFMEELKNSFLASGIIVKVGG